MPTNRSECLPPLTPGRLHLWTVRTDDLNDGVIASRLAPILSTDEQNEARRFRRPRDQHQFVIARALARLALSRHIPVAAADWRFDRDENRKPLIAAPEISPPVRFSISHTQGLVACLIGLCAEAAVDVEKIEPNQDLALVARQVLSPAEQAALNALSGADWTARFFDYWTLKEAYAKARGLGLGLPLNAIGFELEPDETIRAHFAPGVDDDPSAWVFWRRHLPPQHTISVAAKKDVDREFELVVRSVEFDATGEPCSAA
jgi:4'-phosphopantetheinyl transferase